MARTTSKETGLTDKQEKFCREFIANGNNASDAYRAAYDCSRMKATTVNRTAKTLHDNPKVYARISALRLAMSQRNDVSVDSLLRELEEARKKGLTSVKSVSAAVSATMGKAKLLGFDKRAEKMIECEFDRQGSAEADFRYLGIPAHVVGPSFGQFIHDVRNDAATHFWHKGGRGSLKSTTISEALIDDLVRHPDSHAVVLRNTFNTLHDSVYSQLIWAIDQLGLADSFTARKSPLGIIYNATGQTIFFRGLDDPLKLKSIKPKFGYIRNIWFEEVAEIGGMETIRNVLQSLMRGGEVFHCFYSYNPPKSRNNWVNVAVEEEALRPDTKVYHTDYLTVPRPWLGEPFLAQAEHLKSVNETAYRHEYLGEATGTGGDVFDNVALEELPDGFSCQMERYGIDFGYATDPFAWIHCGYDRLYDTLYIFDEFYRIKVHDDEAARTIKQKKAGAFAHYCDCADPKAIANLQREGLNTYACKKFSGSRDHGYRFLQRWAKIVIDPRRCPNAAREFAACEYERNKDGEFVAVIPKKDDHTIDAVRYALDREIDGARAATSTYVSMA